MAYNVLNGSKLTATGGMVEAAGRFRVSKRVKTTSALSKPKFSLAVVNGALKIVKSVPALPSSATPRVKGNTDNRFVVQKIARTPGLFVASRDDKGGQSACATRVIRKTIHVGHPAYQGAGVWA